MLYNKFTPIKKLNICDLQNITAKKSMSKSQTQVFVIYSSDEGHI